MKLKMSPLGLYYTSMIIFMVDAVPLILYTLIIKPTANLYNEHVTDMVSPVFGNYAVFLDSLFVISMVLTSVTKKEFRIDYGTGSFLMACLAYLAISGVLAGENWVVLRVNKYCPGIR